jgi:ABC-type Fe3+/spermidine/putrescine transport system ATPase subunit
VDEVFNNPSNRFVARYAGIRNFFRVVISGENGLSVGVTEHNVKLKLNGVSADRDSLLLIKNDSIVLTNEKPVDKELNVIKGKVTELIPSEFGMEVTIDAGEMFYINIITSDLERLNLVEEKEVWVSFPSKAIVVLSGTV